MRDTAAPDIPAALGDFSGLWASASLLVNLDTYSSLYLLNDRLLLYEFEAIAVGWALPTTKEPTYWQITIPKSKWY